MELKTRQLEIIEAAGRLLTQKGINGLTIKNLAKEMKFSESAIYRHFESKEEIIVALLRYLADTIETRLRSMKRTGSPDTDLKTLFDEQFLFFSQHHHFVVAVFSDGLMEESRQINEAIQALIGVMAGHLTTIIKDGQSKGVIRNDLATDQLVQIILGTYKLHMFKWRLSAFTFDLKAEGSKLVEALLLLIKN
ncbi:MAG: TetR/AcrR family transcriptional regulator [Paludibacter sp.]|jgi:AcrR family transcriptional regulator|nr:TetR/AcrR family transcriptional regulator [Paludibacter sp.]